MSVRTVLADYHADAIRRGEPSTSRLVIYGVAKAMGRFPLDMHDAEFALFVERTIQALVVLADEQQQRLREFLINGIPPIYVCECCAKNLQKAPDKPTE